MITPKKQWNRRVFEQFPWVEVGPSKIALPRLGRQRVEAKDWQDERLKV